MKMEIRTRARIGFVVRADGILASKRRATASQREYFEKRDACPSSPLGRRKLKLNLRWRLFEYFRCIRHAVPIAMPEVLLPDPITENSTGNRFSQWLRKLLLI